MVARTGPTASKRLADQRAHSQCQGLTDNYELSVIPRCIFAADGTLLLPTDNASIIHAIEAAKLPLVADAHGQSTSVASVASSSVPSDERETTYRAPRVLIIDAMAVVQCMNKAPGMTSIVHLMTAFNSRIERMVIGYREVQVIFDRYLEVGLNEKTRKKRATSVAVATAGHVVHDDMSINTISLKQLLLCTSSKHSLTCYLGQCLLELFDGIYLTLVVVNDHQSSHGGRSKPIHNGKLITGKGKGRITGLWAGERCWEAQV